MWTGEEGVALQVVFVEKTGKPFEDAMGEKFLMMSKVLARHHAMCEIIVVFLRFPSSVRMVSLSRGRDETRKTWQAIDRQWTSSVARQLFGYLYPSVQQRQIQR